MKFYTSDLHLDHANMLKYEPNSRPFDDVFQMNEEIVRRWNAKVKSGDEVYILGDFCFDKTGENANAFLKRLNGQKYLIRGNHDNFLKGPKFDRSLFVWIKDYAAIKDGDKAVILFHYPIAVWDRKHHGSIHLYGHIHSNTNTPHPMEYELGNAYNVGVDVRDLEPKTLEEILKEGQR